ncbi:ABC transporter permease [Oceanispirochaeta crateris]|uniref:ABC transporter permease n=1 Tax=Oceanispirochaeta crateris TaxID=2518645 RepID=A0A5C1QL70_9SPIO|nr:ABC transporter permease [Oceanispirochaeta crateris]QEN08361.1 ABC transporter permease [Oceanispirochaeta crateris]
MLITTQKKVKKLLNTFVLEIILLIIILIMSFTTAGFFSSANFLNILRNMSLQGVIAFGMTMVIIAGEIDLSIGSTVALSGVITGLVAGKLSRLGIMSLESAVWVGMIVALIAGGGIGFFIGWLRTRFNMPTFIISLGMMNISLGFAAVLSKGFPITTFPEWFNVFGAGRVFGLIPVPAIILLILFVIMFMIMELTKFGRSVYAVGGNPESARLSGINVTKVKIISMVTVQLTAVLAGILTSSQVMSGTFSFGRGWELNVISAVIIGGASLNGGRGKVWGTFVGLIFLYVIINAMTLLGVDQFWQYVVRGVIIIAAVLMNTIQSERKD